MSYGVRRSRGISPQLLIGIIILSVALLMLCVAGFFLVSNAMRNRQGNESILPGAQPEMDVPTAREAYIAAVEMARDEDQGAQLTSAAGEWTPNIHRDNLNAGRTSWTYYFYMPSTNTMTWVTVERGGEAHIAKTELWDTPPQLIDDQGWQTDSAQAISVAMESCQTTLNAYPESTVEARLSLAASGGGILWYVTVTPLDPDGEPCRARIDGIIGVSR